jgi:hypothetical protein
MALTSGTPDVKMLESWGDLVPGRTPSPFSARSVSHSSLFSTHHTPFMPHWLLLICQITTGTGWIPTSTLHKPVPSSFIRKCLLSTFYVPDSGLNGTNTLVNKIHTSLACISVRDTDNNHKMIFTPTSITPVLKPIKWEDMVWGDKAWPGQASLRKKLLS